MCCFFHVPVICSSKLEKVHCLVDACINHQWMSWRCVDHQLFPMLYGSSTSVPLMRGPANSICLWDQPASGTNQNSHLFGGDEELCRHFYHFFDMIWYHGMKWYDMGWNVLAWFGLIWYHTNDLVWFVWKYFFLLFGLITHVWYDTIRWFDMPSFDLTMIWYGLFYLIWNVGLI